MKHGSAVLYFVCAAVVVPLTSLVLTTQWFAGVLGQMQPAAASSSSTNNNPLVSVWQVVGLVVTVGGCGLYVLFDRRQAVAERERLRARSLKDVARDTSDDPFRPADGRDDDPTITESSYDERLWGDPYDDDDDGGGGYDDDSFEYDPDEDYRPVR